jgi:hypothetical protein
MPSGKCKCERTAGNRTFALQHNNRDRDTSLSFLIGLTDRQPITSPARQNVEAAVPLWLDTCRAGAASHTMQLAQLHCPTPGRHAPVLRVAGSLPGRKAAFAEKIFFVSGSRLSGQQLRPFCVRRSILYARFCVSAAAEVS